MDKFQDIVKSLQGSKSEQETALRIVLDVLIQREHSRKPSLLQQSSLHRDGLDVLAFLLDFINEIAGYSE